MSASNTLDEAIGALSISLKSFPSGVKTLADLKSLPEKIEDLRIYITGLKAKASFLLTQVAIVAGVVIDGDNENSTEDENCSNEEKKQKIPEVPPQNVNDAVNCFNKASDNYFTKEAIVEKALHGNALDRLLLGSVPGINNEKRKKIDLLMKEIFNSNDQLMELNKIGKELKDEKLKLKMAYQNELYDYQNFVKVNEEKRNKQLETINPQAAKNKSKLEKLILRTNIMKKLITNLIAPNYNKLETHPELNEYLKLHKRLVSLESIVEAVSS